MIVAHIRRCLDSSAGRIEGKNGAAKKLGLHPSTLRARMRKYGIPHGKKRGEHPAQHRD
ncbi:helix-turn-helix domain-containing protein [Desulfocastanea catecholica]